MTIQTFAQAETVLAKRLPGYTPRPQQQALAAFVEDVIANGGHGLAEAGCGTGKSLATMIPAILSGKRTVVATATIALMEQYANKDVPFLEENLGVDFTWALLKGRSNYFCRAKAADVKNPSYVPNLAAMLAEIEENPEHTGDREHFAVSIDKREFSNVASTSNECPGKSSCPFGDVCFAEAAKAKAQRSQVVITNTMMLMTDLKVREMTEGKISMLGEVDLVLVDEGHETEEIATNALKEEIRPNGITMILGEAVNFSASQGHALAGDQAVSRALAASWKRLEEYPEEGSLPLRYFVEHQDDFVGLVEALRSLAQEIADISLTRGDKRTEVQQSRIVRRLYSTSERLIDAITTDDDLMVRWTETVKMNRGADQLVLCTAPVHVGSYLASWLWDETPSVLLSATLSVDGDFQYISDRLGLPEGTKSLSVGTPFDYSKQALLFYPPKDAPSPKDKSRWFSYSITAMQQMITASKGGALLLFTSRAAMTNAYEGLKPWLEDQGINSFIQGEGSNKEIAAAFEADTHSCLFALKSFFTGVDFQGDTCRLVVIDKMPFPVPTDPVVEARSNQINRFGGNSFGDLLIPMMSLSLNQGYGRAIRTVNDRATIAILDQRLNTTWGNKIVRSLPSSPRTSKVSDIAAFFA